MAWTRTYDGDEPVRINKWMAQNGVCSRREAEALIAQGQVVIDGVVVRDPGHKIEAGQTLSLGQDGQAALNEQLTVIFHKPVGIVSAQPDPGQIPAVRMIKRANHFGALSRMPTSETQLAPVGRLDRDSRGLLLLSEDGVLAKAIIGPQSQLEKHYQVTVEGDVTPDVLETLRFGLELDDKPLKRAEVEQIAPGVLTFTLREGRNRQIRRMCELVGLVVTDLSRDRIGPLALGDLPEGMWRLLSPVERSALIAASNS